MSGFDFKLAALPVATPLQSSHAANQIEGELKELFTELFSLVGKDTFDASVLGAPHLGSFDLVRRMVSNDGLILLKGDREEAATRYLYRAWKSGDVQKRGLHFLRTYLQMLFPGEASVQQMWHDKRFPYGEAFINNEPRDPYWFHFLGKEGLKLDGSWKVGRTLLADADNVPYYGPDEANLFLTSRIEILLGLESLAGGQSMPGISLRTATSGLLEVIRAVIPARLVPVFRFWLRFILSVLVQADSALLMRKESALRYGWCGRVITDAPDVKWQLGADAELLKLPQPLGSFKLGERRGGKSAWHLRSCRISSELVLESESSASAYRLPILGEPGRRIDGMWKLGGRKAEALTWTTATKTVEVVQPQELLTTFHEHVRLNYPETPVKLDSSRRLGGGWRVNGDASIGGGWAGQKLDGFKLKRQGVTAESASTLVIDAAMSAAPTGLPLQTVSKLRQWARKLDGGWTLGAEQRIGRFRLNGVSLRTRKMTQGRRLGAFRLSQNELAGMADLGAYRSLPLNGNWRLGAMAAPEFSITITRI